MPLIKRIFPFYTKDPELLMKTPPLNIMKQYDSAKANKINHVTLVLDTSASMRGREKQVIVAVDNLVKFLAKRSKEVDQETRITAYLFDINVQCVIYDKDVLRMPSLKDLYDANGPATNLVGASIQALDEAKEIPQRYGDHAFLFYVFTDGYENARKALPVTLSDRILNAPDNFTLAALVPDESSKISAIDYGFPRENVQTWDTDNSVEEVGKVIERATESFYTIRSAGFRGTKNLFTLDPAGLTTSQLRQNLTPLRSSEYKLYPVKRENSIAEFVSYYEGNYKKGHSYYELMKPEMIQSNKSVAIQNKKDGKIYAGGQARSLLGLPNYDIKVQPESHPDFKIFVQSTSVNRKLIKGTEILVLRSIF